MEDQKIVVPGNVPKELKAIVAKRIAASNKKYTIIKERNRTQAKKRKAFKKTIQDGCKFFKENKKNIITGRLQLIGNIDIAYAIMSIDSVTMNDYILCRYAYEIKAPNDEWKDYVANGLCGQRLKVLSPWSRTIPIPKRIWYFSPI